MKFVGYEFMFFSNMHSNLETKERCE